MADWSHAVVAPSHVATPLDLLVVLLGLSLVPLLAVSTTSFTRIIVVLGLLRTSLGAPSLPPNAVIAALALMLSVLIMTPTLVKIRHVALDPYVAHKLSLSTAVDRAGSELKRFMLKQTRRSDIDAFERYARQHGTDLTVRPGGDPSFAVVAPAFMIGELRAAFAMGFAFALPFAAIDIVVAAVMMSLGMFMVSPSSIALPVKLLLFVAADGWAIVCGSLVQSFR